MKLVVIPEPARWVEPLLATLTPEDVVWAPWAVNAGPQWLRERFSHRHLVTLAKVRSVPGWPVLERVTNSIQGRLQRRVAVDALVAMWLRVTPMRLTELLAPSLSARASFAVARARGISCTLLDDLPSLRSLHRDLDGAAQALPDASFLSNYRAPQRLVVRQEQEWALATHARTPSLLGAARLSRARTWGEAGVSPLVLKTTARTVTFDPESANVLLAGTTASRYGLEVLLKALGPRSTVLVRKSEGSSAAALTDPRVCFIDARESVTVRAVVAPAWVETQPAEVDAALAAKVPVVATRGAAGWHLEAEGLTFIEPGNAVQLTRALERAARTTTKRSA